jgi:hypothetical protein
MKAPEFKIDPEFRDMIPPLDRQERDILEQQIADNGNTVAITVWKDGKELTVVDGHNRIEICKKLGKPLKTPFEEKSFPDRVAAKRWILKHQLGRRNMSPLMRQYKIGEIYLAETEGQGARTDLTGGVSAAERLSKEFQISDQTIRLNGRFARAIGTLIEDLGIGVRDKIAMQNAPITREYVIFIGELPTAAQRVDLWRKALEDRSSLEKLKVQEKKAQRKKAAGKVQYPDDQRAGALERYGLSDFVRLIGSKWPESVIAEYQPTYTQQGVLEQFMEPTLRSLIRLAVNTGWGQEALDDYVTEAESAAAPFIDEEASPSREKSKLVLNPEVLNARAEKNKAEGTGGKGRKSKQAKTKGEPKAPKKKYAKRARPSVRHGRQPS